MEITNYNVYDLYESIVASGLPLNMAFDAEWFDTEVDAIKRNVDNPHTKRAYRLAAMPEGSGHKNFLSGILVSANVTATNVWWMQLERYHFVQIVSSQSKMHCLRQMLENGTLKCHSKVYNTEFLDAIEDDEELVYNAPLGLELTARIATNYLQLRTIYNQRKNHKLKEWHEFCDWIRELPMNKLITGGER